MGVTESPHHRSPPPNRPNLIPSLLSLSSSLDPVHESTVFLPPDLFHGQRLLCELRPSGAASPASGPQGAACWWISGPKGGRRHNSPLNSLPSSALTSEVPTSTWARKGNTEAYEDETQQIHCKLKTEELARAFGALFLLQVIRFITRGSLFIGDPWA
jgi:hypothetical protein